MERFFDQVAGNLGSHLPGVLGAVAILVIGWVLARLSASGVRRWLRRTKWDDRLAQWLSGASEVRVDWADGLAQAVFYLMMTLVLVGCLQVLGLTLVTAPLSRVLDQVADVATNVLAAGLLFVVAWVLASFLRILLRRGLEASRFDQRMGEKVDEKALPVSRSLSEAVYWLTFLFFAPAILEALELYGLLSPVQELTQRMLGYVPQVLGALLIFLVGWFIARVLQRMVASLLAAAGLDRVGERAGLGAVLGKRSLSGIVGAVVYALILVPVLIAALNALALDAITNPASEMLSRFLSGIPLIFAAGVLLAISYVIARLVGGLVTNLLAGIGFDAVLPKLGFGTAVHAEGRRTPSEIAGFIVVVAVLLLASAEAAAMLEFDALAHLISELTVFGGNVVFGVLIFSLGLFLANLVAQTIRSSGVRQAPVLAIMARVAILAVVGAMAIRYIVPEAEVVDMAFTLLLGSVSVAAAIAFGWGGREIARELLGEWVRAFREPAASPGKSEANSPEA